MRPARTLIVTLVRVALVILAGVMSPARAAPCDAPPESAVENLCQRELAELQVRLQVSLANYTELHPEVRALKREIEEKGDCGAAPVAAASSEARTPQTEATITIDTAAARQALFGFGATYPISVLESERMTDAQWRRALTMMVSDVGALAGEGPPAIEAKRAQAMPSPEGFSRELDFGAPATLFRMYERYATAMPADVYPFASINVRWQHPWLRELRANDFRRYLDEVAGKAIATVADWKARSGREPEFLQLWNEPLSGNGELGGGTLQELADTVKLVGRRLREAGYARVRFVVPNEETVRGTLEAMRAIAADGEALSYVGAIAYHVYPYGSEYAYVPRLLATRAQGREFDEALRDRDALRAFGLRLGLPVWMTEVSNGYSVRGPGRAREAVADSIDWIVARAIHVHDEFRYAGASAFFGMMAIWTDAVDRDRTPGAAARNLRTEGGDSLVLIDSATDTVFLGGIGHAIGHYGRWLRRGARYVDGASSSPFVLVSPFVDRGRVVAVLVNTARTGVRANVLLRDAVFAGPLAGDQTRTGSCLQAIAPVETQGAAVSVELPPWSITTVAGPIR